jgi:hypothetical protein
MARAAWAGVISRWRPLLAGAAIAGALSACQIRPPPPLLSPIEIAGTYGYADTALGDNRYQVSYRGPSQRSLRSPGARQQTAAAEHTQAYDFALWHAAQIAQAQGFVGFRVSNVRTNVDTLADDSYDPLYGPDYSPFHRPWGWRGVGPYWGPYGGPSPYLYVQTEIVFDIALLQSLGAGDYGASDTIAQLAKTYPGAAGPSQPPAG